MGYRSEVKIVTTREGYDQMCERVDTLSEGLGTSPLMGSCRKPDFFEESDGCVVFGWDYIKWYEGLFADVSNVADALSEIDECGLPYEFCRIGESWDDIEFRDDLHHGLSALAAQQRRARAACRAVGRHRNRVSASLVRRAWPDRDFPDALLRASPFPALSHARSHGTAQGFGKGRDTFPISFLGRGILPILRKQMRKLVRRRTAFDVPLRFPPCKAREPVRLPCHKARQRAEPKTIRRSS